jgi:hypothetical protein
VDGGKGENGKVHLVSQGAGVKGGVHVEEDTDGEL